MIEFSKLYWRLDASTRTRDKTAALQDYFSIALPRDAAWAIYLLAGRRIKQPVGSKWLRQWSAERAGIAPWLFAECYDRVGDLAETISLILPDSERCDPIPLHQLIEDCLIPLQSANPATQRQAVFDLWDRMDQQQLFVLGKLMTGGFRVGVSRRLVIKALSGHTGIDPATLAHRMMGEWQPTPDFYQALIDLHEPSIQISRPYPFFLANPLKDKPESLGDRSQWLAEWKWDGIRAQLIRREGEIFVWSRGEELVNESFPEVVTAATGLPDGTVVDGEILAWDVGAARPLEFSLLQRRLGRKQVSKRLLDEIPVVLMAFDLLECDGQDIRNWNLRCRRQRLAEMIGKLEVMSLPQPSGRLFDDHAAASPSIILSPVVEGDDWQSLLAQRSRSQARRAEGLMLKRRNSTYQVNRPVGDWWKWKNDPYTIDAVLVYAQRGHGRRAGLYTDYTFAVWNNGKLVPFAKAYSGLNDEEIRRVDAFVRAHTDERFGPVRQVKPELVFELAFEKIQRSTRHKSGIAVRFPRISRWRHDKRPADADDLDTILAMLESE